jgi:uncharacterized protein YkwD
VTAIFFINTSFTSVRRDIVPSKVPNQGLFALSDGIETATAQTGMSRREHSREFFLMMGFSRWRLGALALALFAFASPLAARAASPAELISHFRLAHGEGKVTIDPVLNRIAQEQAQAMAAQDTMGHAVLRPFSDRVAGLNAERAAENLAQGDDTFSKALDQWIGSYGHRSNLLMHEGTRVGIASARSKNGEIYWAMVIAGPEPKDTRRGKGTGGKTAPCELMLNDTCMK